MYLSINNSGSGSQRAAIVIKMFLMGIFVGFIYTVMTSLGMNDVNSAFDAMSAIITVLAVTIPTLLARLRYEGWKDQFEKNWLGGRHRTNDWFLSGFPKKRAFVPKHVFWVAG